MEKILAKITIKQGANELDNFYDLKEFEKLGLPYDPEFKVLKGIGVGSIFQLNNKKWKVEIIYFNLYDETQRLGEEYQFNLHVIFYVVPAE